MAMLRASSYRRIFDDHHWSPNGGSWARCAGQYQASVRTATVDECDCDKLDFAAAKALNEEGLSQFSQDRTAIAALNDRLVRLIELAHCFEEENGCLECQIAELKEKLNSRSPSAASTVAPSDYSLDAVVMRLRKERDEIVRDTQKLQEELECLMQEYEKAAQQRLLLRQEQQDVSEEVDAVTAGCLALREQVAIYEEQLAGMEARHETAVEGLAVPAEGTTRAVAAIKFELPDMRPALDVKERYCQLAESLQYECGAAPSALVGDGDGKQLETEEAAGTMRGIPKRGDISELKTLVSELQKEHAELAKCNQELEDEMEMKKAAHTEEITELKGTIDEMKHQEVDLQEQMKEQCEDYQRLLREKMARDMEIAAYRSLVEGEEGRLCNL